MRRWIYLYVTSLITSKILKISINNQTIPQPCALILGTTPCAQDAWQLLVGFMTTRCLPGHSPPSRLLANRFTTSYLLAYSASS